jgi:hypothetical protein
MNDKTTQQAKFAETQPKALSGRLGVVMSYDETTNTATVVITKEQTDEIDQVLTKVMCPRTLGLQTVAPNQGLQCWVTLKDNNITQPLITHFFNHRYNQYDYGKQVKSMNMTPSYLLGM